MNKLYGYLCVLAVITLSINACAMQSVQAERGASKSLTYKDVLGKSLLDETVADFIASNNCSRAHKFLLCKAAGMALWMDSNQMIETVYLYLNNEDGFEPYQGELPFGLKFYDTMGAVEYKMKNQGLGNAGLPDTASVPDHMHYRATYHQVGITVMYNSPFADEDATIYAILVNKQVPITKELHRIVPSARWN